MYRLMRLKESMGSHEKWEKLILTDNIIDLINLLNDILLDNAKNPSDYFFKYQICYLHPAPEDAFETVLLTVSGSFDPTVNNWKSYADLLN